jgi:hypothetical protein
LTGSTLPGLLEAMLIGDLHRLSPGVESAPSRGNSRQLPAADSPTTG